jgi:transcriptional regulator with XRE-family HTH domain
VVGLFKVGRCRISDLLAHRGMTQRQLADRTGLSTQYISDKANNRGPRGMTLENAKTIAAVLGCHIDDLYEWVRKH